jgi:peptidoglycan-associated lipoprotein
VAGDRVFFSEGSFALGTRALGALGAQAGWLNRNPSVYVTVEGHADDPGSARENVQLSLRRAGVVRQRLIDMGVSGERIRVVAYGRTRLLADCPSPSCAAQNRRAVTVVDRPLAAAGREMRPDGAIRYDSGRRPPRLY